MRRLKLSRGRNDTMHVMQSQTTDRFSCSSAMLPLMLPIAQHSVLSGAQAKSLPFIWGSGQNTDG